MTRQADSPEVQNLLSISGESPFPDGCGVSAVVQISSEVEPFIAVNPTDPNNIIAAWQQDRMSDSGALANVTATSSDGGQTWTRVLVPGISRCTEGRWERAGDPWIAISRDGTAYLVSLCADGPFGSQKEPHAVVLNRSTDGGKRWSGPMIVSEGISEEFVNKPAITADPIEAGTLYLVWNLRFGDRGHEGKLLFSRSADAGETWSSPRRLYTSAPGWGPITSEILVVPGGRLLSIFMSFGVQALIAEEPPATNTILSMWSDDRGETWWPPNEVAKAQHKLYPDPKTGQFFYPPPLPDAAVAPDGTVYVAWQEIVTTASSRILLSKSSDGGTSWTAPVTVAGGGWHSFMPSLAVMHDGTVGITYYDFRNALADQPELNTDVWFAYSRDQGKSWSEIQLAGPFDMRRAPLARNGQILFLGDYQRLAALPGGFAAVFAQAEPQSSFGASDIFFARVVLDSGLIGNR